MAHSRTALLWFSGFAILATVPQAWCDHPHAHQGPVRVDAGFQWRFNVKCGGAQYHLGPWYSYFPYESHFQMIAPYGGSSWLQQQPLYGGQQGQQCPPQMPPAQNGPPSNTNVQNPNQPAVLNLHQPATTQIFGNYGPPPSYWYR